MAAAARGLGLVVGDVVLTADEIRGLMSGLLTSTEPALGQIAFSEWTNDGRLRHPSFQGLRRDKLPHDVVREAPARIER